MAGGLKPGQVPDWRPGAEFWKPLADGREVTVYPLLHGKGRLCVGPLADPNGYDIAYRYKSVAEAVTAAKVWDGERSEHPPNYEEIEFGGGTIPGSAPIHSQAFQPGAKVELNETFMRGFTVTEERKAPDQTSWYSLEGVTEDGKQVEVKAIRHTGDPVGANGTPIVTVLSVTANSIER
jgi:hypothetical protein